MDVHARILVSSHTSSGTRSHRKSDAQTVPSLHVSNASTLTSTTVVTFRSQPLAFAPPVSSNTGLVRQVRSDSSQFSSREQPQGACGTSCNLPRVSSSERLLPPWTFHNSALPATSSHRVYTIRVGSLRGLANSATLHLRPIFVCLQVPALRRSGP